MGLSESERRRLDELGRELTRSDPRLSRALAGRSRPASRSVVELLVAISLPLALVGVIATATILFAIASLTLVSAAVISLVGVYRARQGIRRRASWREL
jgi:hypothetical protein